MSGFEYLSTQVKKSVRTDFLRAFGNLGSQERPLYEEEARERQVQNALNNQPQSQKVEKIPPSEKGKARDQAGEAVGVSGKYVDYARQLREEAP